jgi:hypothetical protein
MIGLAIKYQTRVFVKVGHFHASLIFVCKARSRAPKGVPFKGRPLTLPANVIL